MVASIFFLMFPPVSWLKNDDLFEISTYFKWCPCHVLLHVLYSMLDFKVKNEKK